MPRQRTVLIRQFIIDHVAEHPRGIAQVVQQQFRITRPAANRHIASLVDEGVLIPHGRTSGRTYQLETLGRFKKTFETSGLHEDVPWTEEIKPLLENVPQNALNICGIAFTEMLSNVIDHSESPVAMVEMLYTAATIRVQITDLGVGIFRKVKDAYGFHDERESILELAKGKVTTAPHGHTGYGIFFTSRMVDIFSLSSRSLVFQHIQPHDDWLIETRDLVEGTGVEFIIAVNTNRTATEIYNRYCPAGKDGGSSLAFSKTHVPIRLAQYGSEQLVSRSQAKRVLNRFEKFDEVLLDFQGVEFIGQAFADEIFRVFARSHPDIRIGFISANAAVESMIRLALSIAPS